ncbi:MAG: hypothetical protein A2X86_13840 [Bdellovibrionales bacterium GWA2_49_15]|nr:MAG: hypothetical protein A2X86_13840 [Bdellovibrionales bacterium GWA2_49_15]HAZ13609.1 hypothetical protein [Bdellovibrionales bacterium]
MTESVKKGSQNNLEYDLELLGVNLDNTEKNFVGQELIMLDKRIPKNGKIQLQIEKKKNSQTLHGSLKVSCLNSVIESIQDGANIYQLCKKLSREISGQAYKII